MLDLENSSVYFYTSVLNERKVFLDQLGKVAQLVGSVILYTNRLWVPSPVRVGMGGHPYIFLSISLSLSLSEKKKENLQTCHHKKQSVIGTPSEPHFQIIHIISPV